MTQAYRVTAGLIALGVVVQAAAVAFGWFQVINEIDQGTVIDENFEGNAGHVVHGTNGMIVLPILGLLLLVLSFFVAREIRGARMWAAIVFGAIVLQVVLAFISFGAPVVGILHGANALVILGFAVRAAMGARAPRSTGAQAPGLPGQRTRGGSAAAKNETATTA